ncbi:hypothetical protein GPECTOR_4g801 [Gonium pectorale]|uniref:Uncharacterized protein n=1 Tax=Gonium pectorale TaxID=33097 RepID=A0A150GYE5_GONPE|nr:hypothetical protein GPECTOR_4g801 [Gonium pectorale]|eukprot:KXZ54732.1 hypothetical protein GPECTOR_4g801 [Gonium pectorale]
MVEGELRHVTLMTARFIEARLTPDSTRTPEEAEQIAEELQEAFLYEGMSHNNATASGTHQISIESYESFDEIKDIIFSVRHVYDVVINSKSIRRPGAKKSYRKLWKAEFGNKPEPLAERFEKLGPGEMPDYLRESLSQGKATPELEEMIRDAFEGKTGKAWKYQDDGDFKIKLGKAKELEGKAKELEGKTESEVEAEKAAKAEGETEIEVVKEEAPKEEAPQEEAPKEEAPKEEKKHSWQKKKSEEKKDREESGEL